MGKNFIIIGGGFQNKGAQAMIFAVITRIKLKYPESRIWVLTNYKNEESINNSKLETISWNGKIIRKLLFLNGFFYKKKREETMIERVFKEAYMVLDISGFALSSQFTFRHSLNYLFRIALAKKYKTNIILLPQSFGPLNFGRLYQNLIIYILMRIYLKYPKIIYAREQQGYNIISKFTKVNLKKSLDIVLLTDEVENDVLINRSKKMSFPPKSVAIIPNTKILISNSKNDIYFLYSILIEALSKQGYHIFIVRHSAEDFTFCSNLYDNILNKENITFLSDDYNYIELYNIISKMNLIIASRYHSVIHAYKAGIPALVIGWAEKYRELMSHFKQEQFYFDIREEINLGLLNDFLNNLIGKCDSEKKKIRNIRESMLKNENIKISFD